MGQMRCRLGRPLLLRVIAEGGCLRGWATLSPGGRPTCHRRRIYGRCPEIWRHATSWGGAAAGWSPASTAVAAGVAPTAPDLRRVGRWLEVVVAAGNAESARSLARHLTLFLSIWFVDASTASPPIMSRQPAGTPHVASAAGRRVIDHATAGGVALHITRRHSDHWFIHRHRSPMVAPLRPTQKDQRIRSPRGDPSPLRRSAHPPRPRWGIKTWLQPMTTSPSPHRPHRRGLWATSLGDRQGRFV